MGTKGKSAAALAQLARVAATKRTIWARTGGNHKGTEEHGPGRNLRETELRRDSRDAVGTRSYGVGMVQVCVVIVVVGLLLWLVTTYIPIQQPIKNILIAVVVIALVLWLLSVFGVLGSLGAVPVPRVR
jgi:hypothetical protein